MQIRLATPNEISFCRLISSILLILYGRRYELCGSDNCFSPQLANTEDVLAILKIELTAFYSPTGVILFGSWFSHTYMFNRKIAQKDVLSLVQICQILLFHCLYFMA